MKHFSHPSFAVPLLLCAFLNNFIHAAIIYVNDDAPGANDGSNWQNAYTDLQIALSQAKPGDRIHIAQGFYKPAPPNGPREATFSIPDGVIVQGGYGGAPGSESALPHPEAFFSFLTGDLNDDDSTDGSFDNYQENSYHVVSADGVTAGTELRGVIVQSGSASEEKSIHQLGGGLLCLNSTLLLQDCTIQDNQAGVGGGVNARVFEAPSTVTMNACTVRRNRAVYTFGEGGGVITGAGSSFTNCVFEENTVLPVASAGALRTNGSTITNCSFVNNHVSEDAGAIYGGNLEITDCEFINNGSGVFGGAVTANGACLIENCVFRENSSSFGGAIKTLNGSTAIIACKFIDNVGSVGGAVDGDAQLVNCQFLGNYNSPHGIGGGAAFYGSGEIVNCLFAGNWTQDFGIIAGGPFEITNCTIAGNEAKGDPTIPSGAIHNYSGKTQVRNSILWDNTGLAGDQQDKQIFVEGGSVAVEHSIVQGWDGTLDGKSTSGNDPLFVDASGPDNQYGTEDDNPRLSSNSPAIDAGDNAFLPSDEFDLDNDDNTSETIPFDLDLAARIVNNVVDLGTYEFDGVICTADVAPDGGNGTIDVDDLLAVINAWGPCVDPNACPADIAPPGGNSVVDVDDLLAVINAWGACE